MARSSYRSRPRVHVVHRNPVAIAPSESLLTQIREHAEAGEMVRVCAYGRGFYYVVKNDRLFLALPAEGSPIGSFENIAAAVMAGDRHVQCGGRSFNPGGAA